MLKNDKERKICEKYSASGEDGKVRCSKCPLNKGDPNRYDFRCKANSHDKVKAKAFAEGWNACLEKMPRVKTLTGFMVADGKIFDGDEREIMWDKVREIMEKQMLAKLKDVIEYTTTEEEDNIVIIRGKLLVVKKEEREKAINEKAVHFDVLQRDTNQL